MTALERITERVMANGNPEDRRVRTPLLTLEEFFDGNDFVGSIGCNLDSEPAPAEFYELLSNMRSAPDVSDIRVQVTCVDDPGNDWPFSDTVWIFTNISPNEIAARFPSHLAPDEVWEGWIPGKSYDECEVREGHRPLAAWWD